MGPSDMPEHRKISSYRPPPKWVKLLIQKKKQKLLCFKHHADSFFITDSQSVGWPHLLGTLLILSMPILRVVKWVLSVILKVPLCIQDTFEPDSVEDCWQWNWATWLFSWDWVCEANLSKEFYLNAPEYLPLIDTETLSDLDMQFN